VLVAAVAVISSITLYFEGANLISLTWVWTVVLVGGALVFNTVIQTLVPSLNMLGKGLAFTVINISTLVTSLLISYFLCTWQGATAEHWLVGTVFGQILFTGLAYWIFFKNYDTSKLIATPSAEQIQRLLNFCWPISIAMGLSWAHMQGYRFILADRFGLEEFGLFAAGYSVAAAFLSAGETILTTWFQPQFYRCVNSKNKFERDAAWSTYAARMIPATLLGSSALIAISSLLPKIMLGPIYHDVGFFILVGCFAELGRMWVGIFVLHAHQHMSTRQLIFPNLVGALAASLGLAGAILIFDASRSAAPIIVAVGCVLIILLLWRGGLQKDKHASLNISRLLAQAIVLFTAAAIVQLILMDLALKTMLDTLIACALISFIWIIFAFFLRYDLFGAHRSDSKYNDFIHKDEQSNTK
jgi:hypothetical protein